MAKIIENNFGRRNIRLDENDIIDIVREYQKVTVGSFTYQEIRDKLKNLELYIPEDLS
ncbi:TPA: hypothetical protein IAA87_07285 [Candidatus Avigastranaerophilus faecigallinarum]|nr:hypothetical protein [Candidatus Avigastranaerophilus faecigallinarum]